jgi:hypothetical protein
MGTSSILKHSSHSFGEEASGFIGMEMIFLNLSVIYCFVFWRTLFQHVVIHWLGGDMLYIAWAMLV